MFHACLPLLLYNFIQSIIAHLYIGYLAYEIEITLEWNVSQT